MSKRTRKPQKHFVLSDDNQPVEEPNLGRWMDWMAANERRRQVEATKVTKDIVVITEFAGLEVIPVKPPAKPKTYQTMVHGGKGNGMMRGYVDAGLAKTGHHEVVRVVEKYFTKSPEEAEKQAS